MSLDDGRLFFKRAHGKTISGKMQEVFVDYEETTVGNLRRAFKEAVDDYLTLCQNEGIEPDQSFRRSFNVRTGCDFPVTFYSDCPPSSIQSVSISGFSSEIES